MSIDNSHKIETVKILLAKGVDGIGIEKIEKTGTSGLVDTYTITYTDSRKTTFTITNGNGIATVEKTSTSGLVDTYTITFDDGSTETFDITNGRGITKIEKTATVGNVDTYTITYNDGTTSTYEVTNGAGSTASGISFTNNGEGATNVQDAVDNTLELIAPIQLTLTADKTYNVGDQFVYEGLLYEVTATIASGTSITIGSNCQLTDTVAEQLTAINNDLSKNNLGSPISLDNYTSSSNIYTFPSDGYVLINESGANTRTGIHLMGASGTGFDIEMGYDSTTQYTQRNPVYVRKGMKCYTIGQSGRAVFYPFS